MNVFETMDPWEGKCRGSGCLLTHVITKIICSSLFLKSFIKTSVSMIEGSFVRQFFAGVLRVSEEQRGHCAGSGMPRGSVTWPSCRFFTSWASQRLVVVSSFRTWAKVVSLSWSGRHCRRASLALERHRDTLLITLIHIYNYMCFNINITSFEAGNMISLYVYIYIFISIYKYITVKFVKSGLLYHHGQWCISMSMINIRLS